jgi:hypothetical protein
LAFFGGDFDNTTQQYQKKHLALGSNQDMGSWRTGLALRAGCGAVAGRGLAD